MSRTQWTNAKVTTGIVQGHDTLSRSMDNAMATMDKCQSHNGKNVMVKLLILEPENYMIKKIEH